MNIYAHRGASARCPENTMTAFITALTDGADGIELDVHLTKDDIPVVLHDATLKRTTGLHHVVRELTWTHLQALLVEKGFKGNLTPVPKLQDVLVWGKQKNMLFNIELKWPRHGNVNIEKIVLNLVKDLAFEDQTMFSSFYAPTLHRLKHLDRSIETALIVSGSRKRVLLEAGACQADGVHMKRRLLQPMFVQHVKKQGFKVRGYTLNQPIDLVHAYSLSLDGVITDRPALARRVIAQLQQ
ncbi:hypothetical protein G4V62_01135 [Bacillaceae bacterium SIJ1]|uniref:glycerophosphodiester phosphodiesterase n=1 Tax=Litoribacterium kuwaitense TaxID=1398745 RepID=UPI0013EA1854|nr:glycerophosphodiester phosphodiesterase family protein [Litoribacterium kuwaitense]NGP43634.1 hypothetical protein [Litoribacterium kuwaitense]